MSVSASIEALKMAEVVVLCVDADPGPARAGPADRPLIEREGRACVLALNKWDAVADRRAARRAIADRLEISLAQMKGIPVVTLSALTGAGTRAAAAGGAPGARDLEPAACRPAELNRWFEGALERHAPPMVDGRRLKLRYITQAKARPPTFVVFGTRAEQMPEDYQRYLVNSLREQFALPGVPIRLLTTRHQEPLCGGVACAVRS